MSDISSLPMIRDLQGGRVMVVSDLHGNWEDYRQVIRRWNAHKAAGEADTLVLLGDLVHARGEVQDASMDIMDDLIFRKCNQAGSNVYCLLGNHEMVHIYHIELWKGNTSYTEGLEAAMAAEREKYIRFMMEMPFALRTAGGVLFIHAGANKSIGGKRGPEIRMDPEYMRHWPHESLLELARQAAGKDEEFDPLGEYDPKIGWHFTESPEGRFLWEFLMNKNELAYGAAYPDYLRRFLMWMSRDRQNPLNVLVSGHIHAPVGTTVVDERQLRISSGYGAAEDKWKRYLLVDAEKTYSGATELESCARPVYKEEYEERY